jgi:hypothetical protein
VDRLFGNQALISRTTDPKVVLAQTCDKLYVAIMIDWLVGWLVDPQCTRDGISTYRRIKVINRSLTLIRVREIELFRFDLLDKAQ